MGNQVKVFGIIATCLLGVLWLTNALYINQQPLYIDSFFTVGAGAKLFIHGHGAETFMLYGLINPFLLEGLLNAGLGSTSPAILRLAQMLMTLATVVVTALSLKALLPGKNLKTRLTAVAVTMLSSTVLMRESLEPLPETGLAFCIALSALIILRCRKGFLLDISSGVVLALLTGFRPVAFIMAIPVLLVIPGKYYARSAAGIWKWALLAVSITVPVLMGLSESISEGNTILIIGIAFAALTLTALITDVLRGKGRVWLSYLIILGTAVLLIILFFPHYFNHWDELMRQIADYHFARETPVGDAGELFSNIGISLAYLAIAFPGILAAVGAAGGLGFALREKKLPEMKHIALIALGLLPFLITSCRNENYQPRYLIPLLPITFLFAGWGISRLLESRKFRLLLLIPFFITVFQLGQAIDLTGRRGGMITALRKLESMPPRLVSVYNMSMCVPEYYADSRPVFYPIIPYINLTRHVASPEQAYYCIAYKELPAGFVQTDEFGYTARDIALELRNADNGRLAVCTSILHRPYLWRQWGRALIGVRNI